MTSRPAPGSGDSPDLDAAARALLMVSQIEEYAVFMIAAEGYNLSWNPGVERVLGYTEDEFVGQPIQRIFTPEDVREGIPRGELEYARTHGRASDDRWMLRKNGTRFWASGITSALRDRNGQLLGYGKILRDLTAERELQDRLAESEERLRSALAAARVATWRWDLRTEKDTIDAGLARLLELGNEDVTVTLEQFFARVHPEDRDRTRAAFERAVATAGGLDVEFRVVRADGSVRWLRDYGETVLDHAGQPQYLTGAVLDVTEQRESEEQLRQAQRMDAVGKLAGGMAHEVNNMMSVVLGFTDLVLGDLGPNDRRRHDLEQVRAAASRAAAVTGQLLAFSRRQLLKPTVVHPAEVVESLRPVLRRLLGEDRQLTVRAAPETPAVRADRGQLEQVLINLALNARDAMEQGGRLTMETDDAASAGSELRQGDWDVPAGSYAMLTVHDTGHGMDPETLDRIFEPFFTTKPAGQGTGLGLAVVHGIIHQSGGFVRARSRPDAGTTFTIYLPAVPASIDAAPSEDAAAEIPHGRGTILIVEDEPMVRRLVVRTLEQLGYHCLEAGDGAEALELLQSRRQPIEAVVSDIVMPRMSGRELAEQIAAVRPGTRVLFMSGYTDDEMVRRHLLVPGAPFIQKPFETDDLARRLQELLQAE